MIKIFHFNILDSSEPLTKSQRRRKNRAARNAANAAQAMPPPQMGYSPAGYGYNNPPDYFGNPSYPGMPTQPTNQSYYGNPHFNPNPMFGGYQNHIPSFPPMYSSPDPEITLTRIPANPHAQQRDVRPNGLNFPKSSNIYIPETTSKNKKKMKKGKEEIEGKKYFETGIFSKLARLVKNCHIYF